MSTRRRALWSVAAGAVALALFLLWCQLRPEHAAILAIAFGALTYTALRTVERLVALYRRK